MHHVFIFRYYENTNYYYYYYYFLVIQRGQNLIHFNPLSHQVGYLCNRQISSSDSKYIFMTLLTTAGFPIWISGSVCPPPHIRTT